ncbi:DinB family protein [Robiginitalea sp.]|uniref:DinB family protein n=1 Tax=Robiginitalea sp. TaxID=1902411 RepID=UPI003C61E02E
MKKIVVLLFTLWIGGVLSAQDVRIPQTPFTKMYLPVWQEAREHCLEVARAMPDSLYTFKPTPVSKTFGEQMVHIGYTIELLTRRYVQGMEVTPNPPDAALMTREQIINLLEKGFDYTTEVIYSIDQDQLDETCVMYHSGNTVSRAFALFYVQDHMANHRAKANLYLRLCGIAPPEYTW